MIEYFEHYIDEYLKDVDNKYLGLFEEFVDVMEDIKVWWVYLLNIKKKWIV